VYFEVGFLFCMIIVMIEIEWNEEEFVVIDKKKLDEIKKIESGETLLDDLVNLWFVDPKDKKKYKDFGKEKKDG